MQVLTDPCVDAHLAAMLAAGHPRLQDVTDTERPRRRRYARSRAGRQAAAARSAQQRGSTVTSESRRKI